MKQTAVQVLYRWFNDNPEATYKQALEAYEYCLEMEKEQIEDAYDDGANERHNGPINGQDYYNETYSK
jgi:hypothetical protein